MRPPKALSAGAVPTEASIKSAGGIIAHWHDLELLLPQSAKYMNSADGYLHVTEAAIIDAPEDAQDRTVDLLVSQGSTKQWVRFNAFDVQSVCIEGGLKV